MPPLPPLPGAVRIRIQQSMAGVNLQQVQHAIRSGAQVPWTQADVDVLAGNVRAVWVNNFIPLQVTALTLGSVVVEDLSSATGPVGTATGSTAGTDAGAPLSANAAACISWKINRRYRGGHPRMYVGGIAQTRLSNANTWLPAFVTAVDAAAEAFRTAVNATVLSGGGNAQLAVVHYRANGLPLVPPQASLISSAVVDTRVDSQRRRLGRDRPA